MTDAAVDLLRELVAEVRGLRAELRLVAAETNARHRRLAATDHATLTALLPTIYSAIGPRLFSINELVEHARLPSEAALRMAIASVGEPRALGRLMRRAAGHAIDGYVVERVGSDRAGAILRVRGRAG